MRSFTRVLFIVALVAPALSILPGATQPAVAACQTTPLETALDRANSVFVGEVVALTDANRTATMRVIEVWKGRDLPGRVKVEGTAADGSPSNHRTFQPGRSYLVESRNTRSPFEADRCSATKLYNPLGGKQIPANLAAVVGADAARSPLTTPGEDGATGAEGTSLLPFINIALVVLAVVGTVWMYRKVTRVETRRDREAAVRAESEKASRTKKKGNVDHLGKMGRKLSVTGSIGRSGLESSRRLRGRRGKSVATRSAVAGSKKSKQAATGDDVSDS